MADKCLFSGGYGGNMADILLPMNKRVKRGKNEAKADSDITDM